MALNKKSFQSDAVVNLYRAALYLARGSKDIGLEFLAKAREKLGDKLDPKLARLIKDGKRYLKNQKDYLFWAEKTLDQYLKFKHMA